MQQLETMAAVTPVMARELAVAQKVCIRPIMRRVIDRDTDTDQRVAIPCGSTRESVCPSCAHKARILRMQQCAEGWHRTEELDPPAPADTDDNSDDQADDLDPPGASDEGQERRVRSTRRRDDAADLPRVPAEDRTIGKAFTAPDGTEYRPSMFLTATLPSYGPVGAGGVPLDRPGTTTAAPRSTRCTSPS